MNTRQLVGYRIRELRKKRGYSQEHVAALANITAKHVSSIELGKENPTLDTLQKLADVFKVELWELLNYGHDLSRKELQSELSKMLKTLKDNDLLLVLKFINTITK